LIRRAQTRMRVSPKLGDFLEKSWICFGDPARVS
jgi:hypothetical protein